MLKRLCFFAYLFLHVALYMWQIEAQRHLEAARFLVQLHNDSMAGTVGEPYIYRVLVPYLLSPLISANQPQSYIVAYMLGDLLATWLMLILLFLWCKQFVSEAYAMLGVLLVAFSLPLMLRWWFWSVSTPVEVCLWLGGLFILRRMWLMRSSSSLPPSTETAALS